MATGNPPNIYDSLDYRAYFRDRDQASKERDAFFPDRHTAIRTKARLPRRARTGVTHVVTTATSPKTQEKP